MKPGHGLLGAGHRLVVLQLLSTTVQDWSGNLQYYLSNPAVSHLKVCILLIFLNFIFLCDFVFFILLCETC